MPVFASAPGRVNLIGEHTDYNGGRCLPFAIGLRTTVSAAPRDDATIRVRSAQRDGVHAFDRDGLQPGAITGWAGYVAGVLWALQQDGWSFPGLDITVDGNVPLGAGLASSAALECAVATAIAALLDRRLDRAGRRHLAKICVRAETEYVGAATGGMDQTVAMLGASDHGLLLDFADGSAEPVPLPLRAAGLTVLVIDTGQAHALADAAGGYAQRRTEAAAAAEQLRLAHLCAARPDAVAAMTEPLLRARARHAVSENQRVGEAVTAIERRDWHGLGDLLLASHASLRDDYQVSTPPLDLAVDTAVAAGALGARLVGGGFGGSAIALMPEGRLGDVRNALDAAFAAAGHPRPTYHLVAPAAGAAVT